MKSQILIAIIGSLALGQIYGATPYKSHFRDVEHCTTFLPNKEAGCQTCEGGWFASDTTVDGVTFKTCSQCKTPCKECQSLSICTSCPDGYYLDGTSCTKCADGCTKCTGPDKCEGCIEGYRFNSGKCTKCKDKECKKCSQDIEVCETCSDFHFIKDGKTCATCSENCIRCENESKCLECKDGYSLWGSS